MTDQTNQTDQTDQTDQTPGIDPGFPDFSDGDFVPATEAEAIEQGAVRLATIGLADDGIYTQLVRVYVVDDQAVVYRAGGVVTSAPVAEIPRLLHRAVKLYNTEVAAL